ncbi:MAG: DUF748 domain-containing protein [Candidatus Omnitrophica bacterium]|nr:DUF748 domain-containing protein [Candidatus Omnitrophota bacterium]MCM8831600.1 DUF748 domain-containing protein [Candidatus Omnitrophota bacterium]
MKIFKKIFFTLIILVIFCIITAIIAIHIFIKVKGKDFLTEKFTQIFGRQVKIEKVSAIFPLNFYIKNIEAKDLFKVDEIYVKCKIFDILRNRLSSVKVVKPTINIDSSFFISTLPKFKSLKGEKIEEKVLIKKKFFFFLFKSFYINGFFIQDGTLYFVDNTVAQPFIIKIENINANIDNLGFPNIGLRKISFQAEGEIFWKDKKKGSLRLDGWINYSKKNMDARIFFENVDYCIFDPYYPPFWKSENLGIKEAYLSLTSYLNSKNNDLIIDNILSLEKIVFVENPPDPSKVKYLQTILSLIQGERDKPLIHFRLQTKMDNPKIDFSNFQYNFKGMIKFTPSFMAEKIIDKSREKIFEGISQIKEFTLDNAIKFIIALFDKAKEIAKLPFTKKSTAKTNIDIQIQAQPLENSTIGSYTQYNLTGFD